MNFFRVKSAQSFRQFRVAVFGFTTFLRLAWGFMLALNAFSLTTQADYKHQIVSIFMFTTNATAFVFVLCVGTFEAFHFRLSSWTSQARFEIMWISFFWVVETAGAIAFTILSESFQCNSIVRIDGDATGAVFAVNDQLSPQRPTTSAEANLCQLFNRITFIGAWVAVGISLVYVVYLALMCFTASRRDPRLWRTPINKFDWSIISEPIFPKSPDLIRPDMIQRPGNPHLSKDLNGSMLSLPPVFVDPFQARKDSTDSETWKPEEMEVWQPEAMEVIHYPLDRHAIMAQYQPQPIQEQQWQYMHNQASDQHRPRGSQSSALGLEGMEGPAIDHRKSKPRLSIYVPPQPVKDAIPIGAAEEDYERIGRTMSMAIVSPQTYESHAVSEEPCAAIGRRMSMPFASPNSSDESSSSQHGPSKGAASSSYTKSRNTSQATNGHATSQNVHALTDYSGVQQPVHRQSTMLREDSMTARRSMRYGPSGMYRDQAPSQRGSHSGILPLHIQDLSSTRPQSYSSYQSVQVHNNSAVSFQSAQPPRAMMLAPPNSWPAQSGRMYPTYGFNNGVFPLQFPPPPNSSPVRYTTPAYAPAYYENSTQGHISHSRSSSMPSSYREPIARPIPALLDALSPVVRNSGNFQGARVLASHSQLWGSTAVGHPFLDDNPFGGRRSTSRTPEGSSFEEIDPRDTPNIPIEEQKRKRVSKLRKSPPRDF